MIPKPSGDCGVSGDVVVLNFRPRLVGLKIEIIDRIVSE